MSRNRFLAFPKRKKQKQKTQKTKVVDKDIKTEGPSDFIMERRSPLRSLRC
jgi:hypothetical protein